MGGGGGEGGGTAIKMYSPRSVITKHSQKTSFISTMILIDWCMTPKCIFLRPYSTNILKTSGISTMILIDWLNGI